MKADCVRPGRSRAPSLGCHLRSARHRRGQGVSQRGSEVRAPSWTTRQTTMAGDGQRRRRTRMSPPAVRGRWSLASDIAWECATFGTRRGASRDCPMLRYRGYRRSGTIGCGSSAARKGLGVVAGRTATASVQCRRRNKM